MKQKDWLTAFVLCALFGIFGAHRFYTRRIATGTLQFVFSGVPIVIILADIAVVFIGQGFVGIGAFYLEHLPRLALHFLGLPGCSIWPVVDAYMILSGSFRDGAGNPLLKK